MNTLEHPMHFLTNSSHSWKCDDAFTAFTANPLQQKFNILADQWRRQKVGSSNVLLISMLQPYSQIIALGWAVVPLILQELQRKPDHWFYALHAITMENPVNESDAGNMKQMASAWIQWGIREGFLV